MTLFSIWINKDLWKNEQINNICENKKLVIESLKCERGNYKMHFNHTCWKSLPGWGTWIYSSSGKQVLICLHDEQEFRTCSIEGQCMVKKRGLVDGSMSFDKQKRKQADWGKLIKEEVGCKSNSLNEGCIWSCSFHDYLQLLYLTKPSNSRY